MPVKSIKIKSGGRDGSKVVDAAGFVPSSPKKGKVKKMSKNDPEYISTLYGARKFESTKQRDNEWRKDAKEKMSFEENTNKKRKKDDSFEAAVEQKLKNGRKMRNMRTSNRKQQKKKKKRFGKKLKIFLGAFFIFLVAGGIASYFLILTPALAMRDSVNRIQDNLVAIAGDFEDKDLTTLDSNMDNIKTEISFINSEIEKYSFLGEIGLTKGYYDNLIITERVLVKTEALIDKALPDLKETLEYSGFNVSDTPVNDGVLTSSQAASASATDSSTGEEDDEPTPISLVLAEMPRFLALYENIEPDILDILNELEQINPAYIPSFGGFNYASRFEEFRSSIKDFPDTADQVTEFLAGLPNLLGSNEESRFLIILQNESEMRASGGLLTAYGNMTLENGELKDSITLTDTWNLQNYLWTIGNSPPYSNIYGQNVLMNMGCGANDLRAQDSGIYPDLQWTAEIFEDYYSNASAFDNGDFPPTEHMFVGNFKFAEDLLELVQPLEVEDFGVVTADTLFEFIKLDTDDPELAFSPERKRILDDIANAAEEKFTELPGKDIPKLVRIFIDSIKARDIAISSTDPETQAFLDRYQMSGRSYTDFDGDYFHLNEAQNCALKLNKFVRDSVDMTINIGEDGSINKDIRVEWENQQVYDDSLEKLYSPSGNFLYRAWVRVFAPEDAIFTATDGLEASNWIGYFPQQYYDEVMFKETSDNIIAFDHRRFSDEDPIPGQELNVGYQLPESLNYNTKGVYKMLLEKHPGKSWGEPYNITINWEGQEYNVSVVLNEDKILTFRDGIITVDNVRTELDWLVGIADDVPFGELDS